MYFLSINSILITLGTIDYYIYMIYSPYLLLLTIILKNTIIPRIILNLTKSKEYITERDHITDLISYSHLLTAVSKSVFELASLLIITRLTANASDYELILFIPNTFVFEIGFDFFHYITHRFLHTNPYLYKLIHKYHHQDYAITVLTTFDHTISDLLVTNLLPLICITYLYPLPIYTYLIWLWYKSLVEMGGHVGKYGTSSSFPQFIWLPRILGIEMYSDNHNMHHTNPGCNFSKRFALWDKIFGTFRNGIYN